MPNESRNQKKKHAPVPSSQTSYADGPLGDSSMTSQLRSTTRLESPSRMEISGLQGYTQAIQQSEDVETKKIRYIEKHFKAFLTGAIIAIVLSFAAFVVAAVVMGSTEKKASTPAPAAAAPPAKKKDVPSEATEFYKTCEKRYEKNQLFPKDCVLAAAPDSETCQTGGSCVLVVYNSTAMFESPTFIRGSRFASKGTSGHKDLRCVDATGADGQCNDLGQCAPKQNDAGGKSKHAWKTTITNEPNRCWSNGAPTKNITRDACKDAGKNDNICNDRDKAILWIEHLLCDGETTTVDKFCEGPPIRVWLCSSCGGTEKEVQVETCDGVPSGSHCSLEGENGYCFEKKCYAYKLYGRISEYVSY